MSRELLRKALEALHPGRDALYNEAQTYHQAMAGYRLDEHARLDAELASVDATIAEISAALSKTEPDDKELESIAERHGVRWGGDFWVIEDADLHPFMRSMLAHTAAEVARAVAAERERCAKVCEDLLAYDEYDPGQSFAAAIRADPQRLQGKGE